MAVLVQILWETLKITKPHCACPDSLNDVENHPKTGIPFDADGFPDFSSVSVRDVKITFTGKARLDEAAANAAAGLKATPPKMTWHHHQDMTTMQLVPRDIHRATGHTGGFSLWWRSLLGK